MTVRKFENEIESGLSNLVKKLKRHNLDPADALHLRNVLQKKAEPLTDAALMKMIREGIGKAILNMNDNGKPLDKVFYDLLNCEDERIQINALNVISKYLPKDVRITGEDGGPVQVSHSHMLNFDKIKEKIGG